MLRRFLISLLAPVVFISLVACQNKEKSSSAPPGVEPQPTGAPPFNVGLVFDVGGRGDKSFNDSAYAGLEMAKKQLPGLVFEVAQPPEGSDREALLRGMAAGKSQLTIGVGFLFTDDVLKIAKVFPDKNFACVDMAVAEGQTLPPNVAALKFREQEGSFLVGAIAGLLTKTNNVGFVGGADSPLIRKFEKGFKAGVLHVNPDCKIQAAYAGIGGDAFTNPGKGKELALSMYHQGADIIFHAAGTTGLGVFKAAEELGKMAIGVDSDQRESAKPGVVLTSMIKRVDRSVAQSIADAAEGKFTGGVHEFGLKEDGVGYVYDQYNKDIIGESVRNKIEDLKKKIISGEITVPSE